jgi:hypothetical protein
MNKHVLMKALELAGWDGPDDGKPGWLDRVDRFADLILAAERERCATLAMPENAAHCIRGLKGRCNPAFAASEAIHQMK